MVGVRASYRIRRPALLTAPFVSVQLLQGIALAIPFVVFVLSIQLERGFHR